MKKSHVSLILAAALAAALLAGCSGSGSSTEASGSKESRRPDHRYRRRGARMERQRNRGSAFR